MEGPDAEDSAHGIHKKKHKKHKKHKKKHHQEGAPLGLWPDSTPKQQTKPQLKLKIKLGGQVLGTKSVPTFTVIPEAQQSPSPLMVVDEEEEALEGVPIEQYRAWLDEDSNLDPMPSPSGAAVPPQDEESRWLEALERGELDVNGDLKRETDETLLTARQKALLQKQQMPALPLFPPAAYPGPPLSEEMLVKREEKARKRRLQAAKKAEESKKQTIERLTKTSKSRGAKAPRERRGRQPPCPMIRYQNSAHTISVSFPTGVPCPAPTEPLPALPAPTLCGVPGCGNPKKYSCSQTHVPLCSLECYRRNRQCCPPQGTTDSGGPPTPKGPDHLVMGQI
ncbi:INO80 complex subunit B [Xenopus tropicalis]|uniref:INO80 complex subunit B n=1 Tax=Xenopus tropicalis TaxID=8364 RepID=B5DEV4_XENTR|nr:INO80 complex subunit B [Xenopus tropicalis]AAI68815.1 Unknown (protein for MGC:188999) [Xenopus tropicalis]|eukprot:NP_001135702.1 INO80 complex subunit B [Xenopus tropicalis]